MAEQHHQPDELETRIAQVCDLEQAGVFERTPVDVASLVRDDRANRPQRLTHRLFIGLQVAAGLALVAGLATIWLAGPGTSGPGAVGNSSALETATASAAVGRHARTLSQCLAGPAGGLRSSDCLCVDFDEDGDVDLADYGAFQRSFGKEL
jgi:hypothetical protein